MAENANVNNAVETTTTADNKATDNQANANTEAKTNAENKPAEANMNGIEKLIQSAVDRATNKLGNENKSLRKQLDELVKKQLTDEERVELERKQEREAFEAEKAQFLKEKHQLYAVNQLAKAEINVGSEMLPTLIGLVSGSDETAIDENIKALSTVINTIVAAKVEETFKQNGRNPSGSGNSNSDAKSKGEILAEKLGKEKSEQEKRSREILDKYINRR